MQRARSIYAMVMAFVPALAYGQWDPEVSMSPTAADGMIEASGDELHFVYATGFGNAEVHYRQSLDQGATWGPETTLVTGADLHFTDAIATEGNDVYVIYFANNTNTPVWYGSAEVGTLFLLHSGTGGSSWDAPCQLTTAGNIFRASLAAWGGRVHVAFSDITGELGTVHYVGSTSRGGCSSWTLSATLATSGGSPADGGISADRPQVAALGSNVYVIWEDGRDGRPPCYGPLSCPDVYFARSTDQGGTFEGTQQELANFGIPVNRPSIGRPDVTVVPQSGNVVAVYQDFPVTDLTNQEIYVTVSPGGGAAGTWSGPIRITNSPGLGNHPVASAAGDSAFLSWADNPDDPDGGDAALNIYFSMSTDDGMTWSLPERVSPANSPSVQAIAETSAWVHVLYWRNNGLYYRRRALPVPGAPGDGGITTADAGPDAGVGDGSPGGARTGCGCGATQTAPLLTAVGFFSAAALLSVRRRRKRSTNSLL